MTLDQWLHLVVVVIAVGASILSFGKFMQRADKPQTKAQGTRDHDDSTALVTALDKRVGAVEHRMDTAGKQMSDLATDVQGWEGRMRAIFTDKDVCSSRMHESESDRRQIRDELNRLWQAIRNGAKS